MPWAAKSDALIQARRSRQGDHPAAAASLWRNAAPNGGRLGAPGTHHDRPGNERNPRQHAPEQQRQAPGGGLPDPIQDRSGERRGDDRAADQPRGVDPRRHTQAQRKPRAHEPRQRWLRYADTGAEEEGQRQQEHELRRDRAQPASDGDERQSGGDHSRRSPAIDQRAAGHGHQSHHQRRHRDEEAGLRERQTEIDGQRRERGSEPDEPATEIEGREPGEREHRCRAGSHRPASRSLPRPHPVREPTPLPSNDSRRPANAQAEGRGASSRRVRAQHLFQRDQNRRSLGRRRLRPNLDHFRINGVLACRFSSDACPRTRATRASPLLAVLPSVPSRRLLPRLLDSSTRLTAEYCRACAAAWRPAWSGPEPGRGSARDGSGAAR